MPVRVDEAWLLHDLLPWRVVEHRHCLYDDVAAFLKGRVAEFKEVAAENVEFVEAVPKSAAGKILRKELRAMEAARAAA